MRNSCNAWLVTVNRVIFDILLPKSDKVKENNVIAGKTRLRDERTTIGLLKLVQISLKSSCFEIKRLRRVTESKTSTDIL
jgi:hypothetical protein